MISIFLRLWSNVPSSGLHALIAMSTLDPEQHTHHNHNQYRRVYITHECYFGVSHVAYSCHERINKTFVPDTTRAYCGAWGDGLDLTISEEGTCEMSLRLKFCSALLMLLVGSGVEGGIGGRVVANPFGGCSGTPGVIAGDGIVGGEDEPGAGSQPPDNPARRVGDLERVATDSG